MPINVTQTPIESSTFYSELLKLLNAHGIDTYMAIPDYVLVSYISTALANLKSIQIQMSHHKNYNYGF